MILAMRAIVTSGEYFQKMKIRDSSTDVEHFITVASYNISVFDIFHGQDALFALLKDQNQEYEISNDLKYASFILSSPAEQRMCGVSLQFAKSYLIFGQIRNSQMEVNLCNFYAKWTDVTSQIKRGIHGDYDCRCQVETQMKKFEDEFKNQKNETGSICYLNIHPNEPVDECALNFLTCRKLVNPIKINGNLESCVWIEGLEYQECIEN